MHTTANQGKFRQNFCLNFNVLLYWRLWGVNPNFPPVAWPERCELPDGCGRAPLVHCGLLPAHMRCLYHEYIIAVIGQQTRGTDIIVAWYFNGNVSDL